MTQRTRAAHQRVKPTKATRPAKASVPKGPTPDDICDAIDAAEFEDELMGLALGNRDAAEVLRQLNDEQRARTRDMQEAQQVYLQLAEDISYPLDQAGRVHDLVGLASMNTDTEEGPANSTLMAIFWTMSLLGYRKTGPCFIKKRAYKDHSGVYRGAHTWVDVRAPDEAENELQAQHDQHQRDLPPDVRAAAARRDRDDGMRLSAEWHTAPEPVIKNGPRPKGW